MTNLPELEQRKVIKEVLTDMGLIAYYTNFVLGQLVPGPKTRQHQELWRSMGATAYDDLSIATNLSAIRKLHSRSYMPMTRIFSQVNLLYEGLSHDIHTL